MSRYKILLCVLAAALSLFSAASAVAESYPTGKETFSIPNERLKAVVVRGVIIGRPSKPTAIACCTTWNSSEGTTGCASFEGDTCPDYAPFEAYTSGG